MERNIIFLCLQDYLVPILYFMKIKWYFLEVYYKLMVLCSMLISATSVYQLGIETWKTDLVILGFGNMGTVIVEKALFPNIY